MKPVNLNPKRQRPKRPPSKRRILATLALQAPITGYELHSPFGSDIARSLREPELAHSLPVFGTDLRL